ncbi:MAG: hypothetical protein JXB24_07680, partial [Bacteroidales bacterium]|nr:hypothetical protein [Bacteroidales bacterium]
VSSLCFGDFVAFFNHTISATKTPKTRRNTKSAHINNYKSINVLSTLITNSRYFKNIGHQKLECTRYERYGIY